MTYIVIDTTDKIQSAANVTTIKAMEQAKKRRTTKHKNAKELISFLNTNSEEVKKGTGFIKKNAVETETDYLLSTKANREHLMSSIDQLNKGKGKAIKTSTLWK